MIGLAEEKLKTTKIPRKVLSKSNTAVFQLNAHSRFQTQTKAIILCDFIYETNLSVDGTIRDFRGRHFYVTFLLPNWFTSVVHSLPKSSISSNSVSLSFQNVPFLVFEIADNN